MTAILALTFNAAGAQELNCRVTVNTSEIETNSTEVFRTLESAIADYMNTTAFTKNHFAPGEKIDCQLFLNVKEYADDKITGELQVQSTRPVYNSTYTTTLFNFKDNNVSFSYREYEPLTFSLTNMESQLTAILNFYAYMILALDYDSFAPQGGQEFYDRAQTIVLQAQSAGESGWRMFDNSRNRASVLGAYTDAGTQRMRTMLYDYHRRGLDEMASSPDKARAVIAKIVTDDLPAVYAASPMSVALNLFHDSKIDELVNIFKRGSDSEKKNVVKVLDELYPTDQSLIESITKTR